MMVDGLTREEIDAADFNTLTGKQQLARNEWYTIDCINEAIGILKKNGGKHIVECTLLNEVDKCKRFISDLD